MAAKKKVAKKIAKKSKAELSDGMIFHHEPPHYFQSLLASISPIVTLGQDMLVRFASTSFLREFQLDKQDIIGKPITDILPFSKKIEKENLIRNINDSDDRSIQNAEFSVKNRIFGYSLFRFEDEVGMILKEITSIKALQNEVENLHRRLLRTQEKERQKIAAELHDSVGQTILAAKLNLSSYHLDPAARQERFETAMDLIDRASEELREIYTNLYPSILRDLGLEAAIRWYAKNYLEVQGIRPSMSFEIKERPSQELEVGVFRMVQELFNNIVKHSGASNVWLELDMLPGGKVRLRVKDNGSGFDAKAAALHGGLGLRNLESRVEDLAGTMQTRSNPGGGAETLITI